MVLKIPLLKPEMDQTGIRMYNKEYGNDTFRNDNLVLSATHTHSGPAGYMQYLMYTISSFGFVEESFQVPTFIILHFIIIQRI